MPVLLFNPRTPAMSILWVMSTPDKHVVGENKQICSPFAQDFSTLFLLFRCHKKCTGLKAVINIPVCFSWPGPFATLRSSFFLICVFWELLASSFLNHLLWLLDMKSLGSKFSCTELGLVPQVNTNFSWFPFKSVFCCLCFSCLGVFCFLFYKPPIENSSQTVFSFLAITIADFLFQTTSTRVSDL